MKIKDAEGMAGIRSRNENGPLRKLRGDMLIKTFEENYGVDTGFRSDMKLETLRQKLGVESAKELLKKIN